MHNGGARTTCAGCGCIMLANAYHECRGSATDILGQRYTKPAKHQHRNDLLLGPRSPSGRYVVREVGGRVVEIAVECLGK